MGSQSPYSAPLPSVRPGSGPLSQRAGGAWGRERVHQQLGRRRNPYGSCPQYGSTGIGSQTGRAQTPLGTWEEGTAPRGPQSTAAGVLQCFSSSVPGIPCLRDCKDFLSGLRSSVSLPDNHPPQSCHLSEMRSLSSLSTFNDSFSSPQINTFSTEWISFRLPRRC